MHIPAVEAEEALQVLAAHDLDPLPAADLVMKDSPYTRTRALLVLSYVHCVITRRRVSGRMHRPYLNGPFYAGAAARVHPFSSAASRQGPQPIQDF